MNKQSTLVFEYLQNLDGKTQKAVNRHADEIEGGLAVYKNNGIPEFTLAALLVEARKQVRDEAAKASGTLKPKRGAEKILKSAKKSNYKPHFHYANTIDGVQYVCDGYRVVAYSQPLELPEAPADLDGTLPDYKNFMRLREKCIYEDFPLDYAEIKEKYLLWKAKGGNDHCVWKTEEKLGYDVVFLLEMMEALPDSKTSLAKGVGGSMKFESNIGVGYLLPCRFEGAGVNTEA